MVEKIRPIHQDDPWKRFIGNDQLQRDTATIQRAVGGRNQRWIHMGDWPISDHGNDKDGKRKGTKFPTITPTLHTLQTPFHSREEQTPQQSRFFQSKTRTRRISCRNVETHSRNREELRIRRNNGSRSARTKFLSVIGKTTGDNDLKKKIKKGDMSVEAITDTIHEYMYEKMKESKNSKEETKIKHVDKKRTYQKLEKERQNKFRKVDCIRCGAPKWNKSHDCPAKTKKCLNCGKIGNYARLCRSKQNTDRRIKHNQQDSEATSAEEDNWTPNKIHSINNTVHSWRQISKDGQPFFTVTVLVNNRPIKFIIDSGSPVTLIPKEKFNGTTTIYPLNEEHRDVYNNKIKFEGKTMAKIESDGEK